MSNIYLEQREYASALSYSFQGLELAEDLGLKEQLSNGNLKIAQIYEAMGDTISSYKYFKRHVAYKDSLTNIASVQRMADIRTDFEVSQKQLECPPFSVLKRYWSDCLCKLRAFYNICMRRWCLPWPHRFGQFSDFRY